MSGNGQNPGGVDLVVIGASVGGVTATAEILSGIPAHFPAPIVVVQHRSRRLDLLGPILQRRTLLPVTTARPGVAPAGGTVYVAEPVRQLVVDSTGRFAYTPRGTRCAQVDPVLASAAATYGERLLAVILSGALDDGAKGVAAVKAAGGRVIAQDRATAANFGMPGAAIATGAVDFVLPIDAIANALVTLAMVPAAADLFRVARPAWAASAR